MRNLWLKTKPLHPVDKGGQRQGKFTAGSYADLLLPYLLLLALYIVATWFTDGFFMGDTRIYVDDVLKANSLGATFWDAVHPLWRPLAWLGSRVDPRGNVTLTLMTINWVSGLVGVFLVYAIASRSCKRRWVPYFVAMTFLFSNPILNYAQTGQPYVTGLSFILLGFYLLLRDAEKPAQSWWTPLLAGFALATGVCVWLPYVFSLPAVGLSSVILFGFDKPRLRLVLRTCVVCGLVGALVYVSMAVHLNIHDATSLKAWFAAAFHGALPDAPLKSIQRMLFTLARSLINMGNDGWIFKRYAVHDPFNPVSLSDLFRLSLWKLTLFYVFLFAALYNLLFSRVGKRTLALLLLNALPLLAFAVFVFEAGSIERYLPIFPVFFLALSVSLGGEASRQWPRVLALLFVAIVIVVNASAMSARLLDREQERVAARISELQPLLKSESRVITVNEQDEVYAFNQNFPFNPINRAGHETDNLVTPHSTQISRWRQIFAGKSLQMWEKGGDVWITTRVLYQRPRPDWNWIEGDDPSISWTDINNFFVQIEMGQTVGGPDGFVLVLPSPHNRQLLSAIVQKTNN